MHDREILLTLERIEKLLMRLCNNTCKDGFYYVPVTGTARSTTSDYHGVTGDKEKVDLQGENE